MLFLRVKISCFRAKAHLAPVVQKVYSAIHRINLYPLDSAIGSLILIHWIVIYLVDSAIHRIYHYPLDSEIGSPNIYPLDSDLSGG